MGKKQHVYELKKTTKDKTFPIKEKYFPLCYVETTEYWKSKKSNHIIWFNLWNYQKNIVSTTIINQHFLISTSVFYK